LSFFEETTPVAAQQQAAPAGTPLVDAAALLRQLFAKLLAPPPRLTVTEWAERHRVLSAKDSAEPGPYRAARTPYVREPMDALGVESTVEQVVLQWGAQTSKTTVGSTWLGYLIDVAPGALMVVQPTTDTAKRYSRQRLAPMFEESARLRELVHENRSRDEAATVALKEFRGGFLAIAGANSAAGLRSMPVRHLFLDEVDAYPSDVDGEGDPVALAVARQSTFARRKRLMTSTPTTKGASRIEELFAATDRCRYHVPCPHCDAMQPLEWTADKDASHGLRWERDADGRALPHTAHYVCRECGGRIDEHHKPAMLAQGAWVAENPGAGGGRVRGFHLSSLYSPLGWLSWSELAAEWERAVAASREGDHTLMRVFVNTRLASTFEVGGDGADDHQLRRRAGDWPLRTVLPGLLVTTAGVDVQADRLEAFLWAWGPGMQRQLVDRAVLWGDPSSPETDRGSPWAALTEYLQTPVLHASGYPVPLLATAIDTGGHHTQAVYAYCRVNASRKVLAVKGASLPGRPIIGKPGQVDVDVRGQRVKRGVKLWPVGADSAKAEIMARLRVEQPGPGYVHLSRSLPAEVFEQLTSEKLVTRYVRGRQRLEWVKPAGRRNEALDCAVYALAAAHWLHMDRWVAGDWSKWRRRVAPDEEAAGGDDDAGVRARAAAPVATEPRPARPARPPRPPAPAAAPVVPAVPGAQAPGAQAPGAAAPLPVRVIRGRIHLVGGRFGSGDGQAEPGPGSLAGPWP
jgi:phage terminase large subunit GpA-like protein